MKRLFGESLKTNRTNIPVIYYHSVAPGPHPSWPKRYLTLSLSSFETHLKYLKSLKYRTITMDEYAQLPEDGGGERNLVVLTFDDGYLDNFAYVYPLLKKYKFKGTIFVNPESVPKHNLIRPNMLDYWDGKAQWNEIQTWGFVNWEEMRIMEQSGVMDIQSHTMSHTKHFISDEIIDFHRPGADSLYYIGNLFPDRVPDYIDDPKFERLLPYGYPVFKQESAIIAQRLWIRQEFINDVVDACKSVDWSASDYNSKAQKIVRPILKEARAQNRIIQRTESLKEQQNRIIDSIQRSKHLINSELNKDTSVCCWPHGDNNRFAHDQAIRAGYKMTTIGKESKQYMDNTRFDRLGLPAVDNRALLTMYKSHIRIKATEGRFPYYTFRQLYRKLKGYE